MDPNIYGIDWDGSGRIREKPFCEFKDCKNRVSTEFGKPKPFCKDHVLENPYVKDLLKRMELIDPNEDRKRANAAFKRAEIDYNERINS